MNVDTVLRRLGDLERSLADLYEWYAEVFASDPEAVYVFLKMFREEMGHVRRVDYHRRLLQKDPALPVDVDIDVAEIDGILQKAVALRGVRPNPTLEDAIRTALDLEMTAAESFYRNARRQASPAVARLLAVLGGEDKDHVGRLREMARFRGIPTPGPGASG